MRRLARPRARRRARGARARGAAATTTLRRRRRGRRAGDLGLRVLRCARDLHDEHLRGGLGPRGRGPARAATRSSRLIDNAATAVEHVRGPTFASSARRTCRAARRSRSSLETAATDDARQTFDDVKDDVDTEIDIATDVAVVAGAIAEAAQPALSAHPAGDGAPAGARRRRQPASRARGVPPSASASAAPRSDLPAGPARAPLAATARRVDELRRGGPHARSTRTSRAARSAVRRGSCPPAAPGSTSVTPVPERPARPVRPTRCVYDLPSSGGSKLITCVTLSRSSPRAATSVAISVVTATALEPLERPLPLALVEVAVHRRPP